MLNETEVSTIPLFARFGVMVTETKVFVINLMAGGVMFSVPASDFDVANGDYIAYKHQIMKQHYNRLRVLREA